MDWPEALVFCVAIITIGFVLFAFDDKPVKRMSIDFVNSAVDNIRAIAFGRDSDAIKIAKIKDTLNDLFEPRKERKTMAAKKKSVAKKETKKVTPAKSVKSAKKAAK